MKIIEVVYNWPAETFIQRHVKALQESCVSVRLVARHGNIPHPSGASIAQS
jgi:hypothetical protein